LSIMQRRADIQTARLHAESRDNIGAALLRANSVVGVEMPDHLARLIRRLVEAERLGRSNEKPWGVRDQ